MSNKHFRRAIEQQLELGQNPTNESGGEDEGMQKAECTARVNKFAFLNDDQENSGDESTSEPEKEESKTTTVKANTTKKTKKKRKKETKNSEVTDDQFLEQIGTSSQLDAGSTQNKREILLKIDPRKLNPNSELRKLLGKTFGKALNMEKPAAMVGGSSRTHRSTRCAGKMVKFNLQWPPLTRLGIFMEMEREENDGEGVKWFRFRHNDHYQELQQLFWQFQKMMDYESIVNTVLVENAYHLDSLLLMAEYMRVQEDVQKASDCIERGLFACESVAPSAFHLFSIDSRLSYRWRENRAFFLLLHYHTVYLMHRSCYVTALQFVKITFMKDPTDDPLGTLLLIDSLALKAAEYQFLIDFYAEFKSEKNLDMLPNFLFSMALAHFFLSSGDSGVERHRTEAETYLQLALTCFPFVLGQILDKLQLQADSAVENNRLFNSFAYHRETEGLQLISDIYLHHSIELWRLPDVISWLEVTTHKILSKLSSKKELKPAVGEWAKRRAKCFVGMPKNVLRHAILHAVRQDVAGGEQSTLVNPCPPDNPMADYEPIDLSAFGGVQNDVADGLVGGSEANRQPLNFLGGLVRSIVPDGHASQLDSVGEAVRDYAGDVLGRVLNSFSLARSTNNNNNNVASGEGSSNSQQPAQPNNNNGYEAENPDTIAEGGGVLAEDSAANEENNDVNNELN